VFGHLADAVIGITGNIHLGHAMTIIDIIMAQIPEIIDVIPYTIKYYCSSERRVLDRLAI
jgi:alpha-D-ribose 1-methylphosphonate 5-triphosphate synthase subunit PhnL